MKKSVRFLNGILILVVVGSSSLLLASTQLKEKSIAKETKKPSINIAGMGTVDTGTYSDIHVAGSATLKGTIKTNTLHVAGQASSTGPITADAIDVSGIF